MLQIKKLKFWNISLKRKLEVCVKLSWIIRKRLPAMNKGYILSLSWEEIFGKRVEAVAVAVSFCVDG